MKLQDLLAEETHQDYVARLTRTLNIAQLGKGTYARVFQHPVYHNVAVKLVKNDPAYLFYIRWCLKHQDNPWLPKIISIHRVKLDAELRGSHRKTASEFLHLVFFEKLRPASPTEIKKAVVQVHQGITGVDDECPKEASLPKGFGLIGCARWRKIEKQSPDPHLRVVAKFFAQHFASDLHDKNVMMRDAATGSQLVFTDPFDS